MRRLIADSGSTKTDWVKIIGNESSARPTETYSCRGLNPHVLSPEEIVSEMSKVKEALGDDFDEISFFGAGVGNSDMAGIITRCLSQVFSSRVINAESDILGAAKAALGNEAGIACIMGTGSNSCHFDGQRIDRKSVSLGYMLDDAGGGVAFGRRLLADVFKGVAPEEIRIAFEKEFNLSTAEVLDHLYHQPSPNKWMATFLPFINRNRHFGYCQELINSQLKYFFDREFLLYSEKELKEEGIGFVGSVAFEFSDQIKHMMSEREWKLREIIRKPIDKLILDYDK